MENERVKYDACPLCDCTDITQLRMTDCTDHPIWREPLERSITWMQCASCEHVFTDGYFTDEALQILFGNTQDQGMVGHDVEVSSANIGENGRERRRRDRPAKRQAMARRRIRKWLAAVDGK